MIKIGSTLVSLLLVGNFSFAGRYLIPPPSQSLVKFVQNIPKLKLNTRFSLVAWNVHKGKDGQGWVNDMKTLAQGADVFLLQEALDDELMTQMYQREIGYFDWYMAKSFTYTKTGISSGVANASSFLMDRSILYRTADLEPIVRTPKTVMLSYMTMTNGQSIALLNIHGLNRTSNEAFFRQMDETLALIKDFSGPVIYAGDFNTNNKAKLKGLEVRMQEYGLQRFEFADDHRKNQLDWIYVRGCQIEKGDILYSVKTSDHAPLYAELNCE